MLPGGPAGKAGIHYECLWAVRHAIDVLHGAADSIRIEPPGEDKAEFVIERNGTKEFHQAKRQRPADDRWTLRNLGSAKYGVLQYFAERARQGHFCVFVSTSDAQELRELADSARRAASVAEFVQYFLNTEAKRTSFRTLLEFWLPCSDTEAFELLKRIRVDVVADRTLEDLLLDCLRPLFESNPQATLEQLVGFILKNIHQTITAPTIQAFLAGVGTSRRTIPATVNLSAVITSVTESYLNPLRARLIQQKPIRREQIGQVLQKLEHAANGVDVLITSAAGGGKTGCMLQIVDALRAKGIAVLAFRLDQLPPVTTTLALGQQLGLPESPVLVLAKSVPENEAVLVIDQLDAVSTTSGRHTDFFATVEALLSEVRGLRNNRKFHVIMACRKFDWQNDHRLKALLPEGQSPVEVTPLAADDLVFRTYAQHEEPEWRRRCLGVIDEMCLEGIYDVISELENFER